MAVGRPCRGEISEVEGGQNCTEGTAAAEGPSVLYQKCQREKGGGAVGTDGTGLTPQDWTGAGWSVHSRTEVVWESSAGRRCLDSPVESCDLYHCCFFF